MSKNTGCYVGISPDKNFDRFLEFKPLSSFPKDALKDIKLLSFSKDKDASPFGSFIYRVQKYPGDVDLIENFADCCSKEDVIHKFVKRLKEVVNEVLERAENEIYFFSEAKMGLDMRYDVDVGPIAEGIYTPNPKLADITFNMYKKKLLNEEENNIVQFILSTITNFGKNEYDAIFAIFREKRIVRWSADDILKGYVILPLNKKMTLEEALTYKTFVKIDIITVIAGRFTEVTNFFQLGYYTKDVHGKVDRNIIEFFRIQSTEDLPFEIEKLYYSDYFYSPFKVVKRIFAYARSLWSQFHDPLYKDVLDRIVPFVSSNTSLLYQIKSDIDTIVLVLDKLEEYPPAEQYIDVISHVLDVDKLNLSTAIELSEHTLIQINNLIIDAIKHIDNRDRTIQTLKEAKKIIVKHINFQTIKYLQSVDLNPPIELLPEKLKYDINDVREPDDSPQNPLSMYKVEALKLGNSVLIPPTIKGSGNDMDQQPKYHFSNFFEDPRSSRNLSEAIHRRFRTPQSFIDQQRFRIKEEEQQQKLIRAQTEKLLKEKEKQMKKQQIGKPSKNYYPPQPFQIALPPIGGPPIPSYIVPPFRVPPTRTPPIQQPFIVPPIEEEEPYIGSPINDLETKKIQEELEQIQKELRQIQKESLQEEALREVSPPSRMGTRSVSRASRSVSREPRFIPGLEQMSIPEIPQYVSQFENDPERMKAIQKALNEFGFARREEESPSMRTLSPEIYPYTPEELEARRRRMRGEVVYSPEELAAFEAQQLGPKSITISGPSTTSPEIYPYTPEELEAARRRIGFEPRRIQYSPEELEAQHEELRRIGLEPTGEVLRLTPEELEEARRRSRGEEPRGRKTSKTSKKSRTKQKSSPVRPVARPRSKEKLLKIMKKSGLEQTSEYKDIKKRLQKERRRRGEGCCELNDIPLGQGQGRIGGYDYAHDYKLPLYVNKNLPLPKLLQNEMNTSPQTAGSYCSDYYGRGYGPSLHPPYIDNAPLVMNGHIMSRRGDRTRAGCDDCGLTNFRKIH
jgi:hypothetical protein